MYSLQTTTHVGLVVSSALLLVTWLELTSQVSLMLRAVVVSGIISVMTYLLMRTLYWGYLATKVINLGRYIKDGKVDFGEIAKLDLDTRAKGTLEFVKEHDDMLLQAYILAGPTFVLPKEGGWVLNLIYKTHRQKAYLYVVLTASFLVPLILILRLSSA